uniref:alkaline phosphatase PhoX n=1 Tax=uncultured Arthrobacter sp. TaxID=114050 RepID=UPI0032174B48
QIILDLDTAGTIITASGLPGMAARLFGVVDAWREKDVPARLQLFVESSDPTVMDYVDNLTVAPWGHLIACEDKSGDDVTNHLKGVTPDGRVYTLARLNSNTEFAGACFSPDGATLFVNAYAPGRTLAITGPWAQFRSV